MIFVFNIGFRLSEHLALLWLLCGKSSPQSNKKGFLLEAKQNHIGIFLWLAKAQFIYNGPAFLWQTQIQTMEYGLNDAIRIKKNTVLLISYSFTPCNMNFQTILIPKMILGKKYCQRKAGLWGFFWNLKSFKVIFSCKTTLCIYVECRFRYLEIYKVDLKLIIVAFICVLFWFI